MDADATVDQLYGPRFLQERPLLAAVRAGSRAVLLVDELDRADDEFEAFLLEALSDSSVTIPEIGSVGSPDGSRPAVIITSNRTRELHDALKRRCLYHWIDYPDPAREAAIIRLRVPSASDRLARSIAAAVARLRGMDLIKPPGAAEAIDWAEALVVLELNELTEEGARATLGPKAPRQGLNPTGQMNPDAATLRLAVLPRIGFLADAALVIAGAGLVALSAQIAIPLPVTPVPLSGCVSFSTLQMFYTELRS